jgi:Caspase domain
MVRCRPALNASVAVAVFYFSGHGSKCQEKEFMLCKDWQEGDGSPGDIDLAKRRYGVSLESVITIMNGAQASIVLLDACRSYFDRDNNLSLSWISLQPTSTTRGVTEDDLSGGTRYRRLEPSVDPCKILVGYSCSDGSFAMDGFQRSEQSPYTTALLEVNRYCASHVHDTALRFELIMCARTLWLRITAYERSKSCARCAVPGV